MNRIIPAIIIGAGIALATCAPAYATEEPAVGPATVTLKWFIPGYLADSETAPSASDPLIWAPEQVRFDGTQYGWCQLDTGDSATLPADEFGPTLHKGEDYGWVKSWTFEKCGTTPVAPEPTPEPTPEPVPPTVVEPPADVPAPVETPVPVAAQPAPVAAPTPVLAATGPVTGSLAIPAAGALVLGAVLAAAARIRKARP